MPCGRVRVEYRLMSPPRGGNAINAILANTYQPRAQRGVGATAQRFGLGMLLYAGSDAYTEFSPDLWYALKKLGSKVTGIRERFDNNSGPPLPKMAYSGLLAPQGKLASAGDWGGMELIRAARIPGRHASTAQLVRVGVGMQRGSGGTRTRPGTGGCDQQGSRRHREHAFG